MVFSNHNMYNNFLGLNDRDKEGHYNGQMVPKPPTKNYDGYLENQQIHHQVKTVWRYT